MRVALAGALFIEPDLLMLGRQACPPYNCVISKRLVRHVLCWADEPTNHLGTLREVMAV